jgi:hypothetical protein
MVATAVKRCLCLTFSPNNTRIVAERREAIPNPLGRDDFRIACFSPMTFKQSQKFEQKREKRTL